jgi:hypothetical protein
MATVYQRFVDLTIRLISQKGMFITLRKLVYGNPVNPLEPWKPTASTATDYQVKCVFLPEETINRYVTVRIPYDLDFEGFEYGLMANNPNIPAPALNDLIIRNGEQLRLKYLKPYAPDGTVILYVIGIKT